MTDGMTKDMTTGMVWSLFGSRMKVCITVTCGRLKVVKYVDPNYSPVCPEFPTKEAAFMGLFPFEVTNMFRFHGMPVVLNESDIAASVAAACDLGSLRDEEGLLRGEVKLLVNDEDTPVWEPDWYYDMCDAIDIDSLYERVDSETEPEPIQIRYRRATVEGYGNSKRDVDRALTIAPWAKDLTEEDWALPKEELRKRLRQGVEVFHEDFLEALKYLKEAAL